MTKAVLLLSAEHLEAESCGLQNHSSGDEGIDGALRELFASRSHINLRRRQLWRRKIFGIPVTNSLCRPGESCSTFLCLQNPVALGNDFAQFPSSRRIIMFFTLVVKKKKKTRKNKTTEPRKSPLEFRRKIH